jgi:uncharacterized OB-fold protein
VTQEMTDARPLPDETALTAPFWQAARERRLVIQRCTGCGKFRWPPEVACYECGSLENEWAPVGGGATLYTWTVAHPPLLPYFQRRSPWPIAVVELDEGARLVTNLVDIDPEHFEIGMPLEAAFQDIGDGVTLVVFKRAGETTVGASHDSPLRPDAH